MRKYCLFIVLLLCCMCLADYSQAASGNKSIYRQKGYVTYYYPTQRGYIAVRYPDGRGGYTTSYIRTYRNRESKNMHDVLYKGTIDMATLGLLGVLY